MSKCQDPYPAIKPPAYCVIPCPRTGLRVSQRLFSVLVSWSLGASRQLTACHPNLHASSPSWIAQVQL